MSSNLPFIFKQFKIHHDICGMKVGVDGVLLGAWTNKENAKRILDVGTGGGFPGIPLAILFPEAQFYLIDIIAKKIKVVQEVAKGLGLKNVKAEQKRAELVREEFDFIVSRAVTNMPDFVKWTKDKTKKNSIHELKNGILYLKGGDLKEELAAYKTVQLYNLPDFFEEESFFRR